ncbi:glycosyltransferase [Geomonas edaphica]|uniref:glycosyltransferase n=1 Tax=Geomonas edaphica TaxID=2570226 RepID=UPI0010A7D461|nr:glycosyltransferase [Geomonas edaphica]
MLVIIFSKDRPLQLEATLRSLSARCREFDRLDVRVIFKSTSELFDAGYRVLQQGGFRNVAWIAERDFRGEVISLLEQGEYVLWLVDDNIFVRDFSIEPIVAALASTPSALGFSLRLGENTTYCYSLDKAQRLPEFSEPQEGICLYDWREAEHDFGYPLEVSSSVYRTSDILPFLRSFPFSGPNALESRMAERTAHFRASHPHLFCFKRSVTFCNPVNKVQSICADNRAGSKDELSAEQLAQRFLTGYRIDSECFHGFVPNACHQEKELTFVQKELPVERPLVSVIIPCYKQAHFLEEAVASVLAQSYSNWECLIVNDGSPDNTSEVARALIAKNPGRRIYLLEKENGGLASARNHGIANAKGMYILPLDSDDLLHPDMLSKTVDFLEEHPETSIVYTDLVHFGAVNKLVEAGEYDFANLRYWNQLNYCSLYRRTVWEAVGGYNTNMTWGYEDWDFWIGCGERGFYGRHLPEPLLRYRVKESSMFTQALEHDAELKAQIVMNHPRLYSENERKWAEGELRSKRAKSPLVSVIVPTHNRPDMLKEAIQSILDQTMKDFEVIVVNDAGEDVSHLVAGFGSPRITCLTHDRNRGLAAARNTGIKAARGKYIAYLDDDDIFYPDHLETLLSHLEASDCRIAYSDSLQATQELIDGSYRVVKRDLVYSQDFDYDLILVRNFIPVLCFMHERSIMDEVGFFDEELTSHEDWDLWVRISRRCRMDHIAKVTSEYRWREDGSTATSSKQDDYYRTARLLYEKTRRSMELPQQIINRQETQLRIRRYDLQGFHPDVLCSIIMPVCNKVECTRLCIETLYANTPHEVFELIIIDDASEDGTAEYLATLKGPKVKIISNHRNVGYTAACNQGAAEARGEFLVFLNGAEPGKGWLHHLVLMAGHDLRIGAVGPKLLSSDGRLDEAGGLIFSDGSIRSIGKGEDPKDPRFNSPSVVDYCTDACLMVRRDLFREAGGFDERYAATCYDAADLCLAIAKLGYYVVYSPQSEVIHHEQASAGFNPVNGADKPCSVDREKFVEKWSMVLKGKAARPEVPGQPAVAPPEVTIVIPVFNGAELTENCLRAITANTPKGMYQVVIVDNGSKDGTAALLKRLRAPEITVISNAENLGFAKACNQGAQAAGGEFILFLNNDTLPHPGWLEQLVAMARAEATIGIVGSKLLYPDDSVQHAGVVVGLRDGEPYPYHVHLCEPSDSPLVNVPREYQMVTGACLMIRSGLFRRLGGFDEAYVNGHEDLDLCMKAREAGAKVMYCPSSVVTHLESRTKRLIGLEQFHYEKGVDNEEGRGRRRFLDRWREKLQIDGGVLAGAGERAPVPPAAHGLSILFTMYGWNETGGGTTFPRSVALELARQGHRVTVFYASLATDPTRPEYALESSMEEGVRLFALYNRPARFTDPDHPEREMLDEGVLQAFRQVLKESAPDVVHFHNFHGLTLAMAQETRRAGIPSAYTPHNYHMIDPDLYLFNSDLSLWNGTDLIANSEAVARNPEKAPQYRLRSETARRLLNEWVDVTLAVSTRQKELLVDFGASPERIAVVHQASRSTDLLWQDPSLAPLGARMLEKPLRFGFIGGVMPHKGVHMLVGAAQLFQPGEAEFHVYGFVSQGYLEELQALDRRGMVVFHGAYGEADLPAIAAGIDVAVVPSVWEDCAPLVLLELMALRLPIIGAKIGGIPDFVEEGVNGFLYRYDSLAELVACLKRCAADPTLIAEMRGRLASPHSFNRYVEHLQEIYRLLREQKPLLLPELELRVRLGAKQAPAPLPAVVWEGSQFVGHSLALVNRELCLQLIGDGYPLSIIPYEEDEFGAEADPRFHLLAEATRRPLPTAPAVHVRHQWPPDFTPPPKGRWVMIQPWEFGSLPVRWVEVMNEKVDEVWVPSSYVRDCYLRSGIRPERVFTVPNGVNTALFNPEVTPIPLKTRKRFKFLFVGGTIARKGIDILLQAYSAAFTSSDDVCLVIKDMGGGSFYQGRTAQELIARYRQNPELPEVEYLDRFLPDRELAGLYTACDCLVHPYRGEGFGLPMAEAMACGLPAIVTGYGAALDFCSDETAYLIPAHEVKLPMKQVGELETVDYPWLAEPDATALTDLMRHVAKHPDEARQRGRAAAQHIARNFTWEKAAAYVRARLAALSEESAEKLPCHEEVPVHAEEPLCSIVIAAAGTLEGLERCLDSIAWHTPQAHEVLLVHDGTQDLAHLEQLARHGGGRLVDGSSRTGDSDLYNAGLAQSRGDVIVLMEQSVLVTPGWLAYMLACLDLEDGAGIVGPMGDGATGLQKAQGPGDEIEAALEEFARSFAARHARRRMSAQAVDPFCFLLTRKTLEAVGELDARLKRGDRGEDLCLRAALAGFGCVIAGDVFLHHTPCTVAKTPETGQLSLREKWTLGGLDEALAKRVACRQALYRAQELARQGRLQEAVDLFLQQGIALAPGEPVPYLFLAEALLDAGSFQNALDVLGQVPKGQELQRLYLSWRCRMALGQEREALALANEVAGLAPKSAVSLYLQGKAAAARGDAKNAEALFRSSCQADPGFAPPWVDLAIMHRERGERREALDLAEKGFVLAPLQLSTLALFHSLAEEMEALPREEERVREACLIYPEHKGLSFGLVEVLIRQGHYLQAMDEIERAAVGFGLDDAGLDAALEIRRLAGPAFSESPCRAAVSVCIIVKDERRHLAAALASVKPLAAELVVVDTGSTDRSDDLARLFGARVFSFPWTGDFSEARNFSLSKASGDWVLVLDADEVLAARDLPLLKELLSRAGSAAFSVTTRNYTTEVTRKNWTANAGEYPAEERGLGWTPSRKVRLFPNDARVRFQGAVHELVEGSLARCGIPVLSCAIPVHHYGKLDNVKCAEKQEHYYLLGMKKLSEGGATVEALTELAIQATELERFVEAEELWRRVLELTPEAAEPYFNLGYLHLRLANYGKARDYALKGVQLAPDMKEAAFNLAKSELFLGNTERASALSDDMLLRWPEYPPALSLLCVCRLLAGETGESEAIARRLAQMGYDCVDFLTEYAVGLARGERGDLAVPVQELAERLEKRTSAI